MAARLQRQPRMKTARRSIGAGLVAVGLVATFSASACRDIVSGDSVDVIAELCGTLDACYEGKFECDALEEEANAGSQDNLTNFLFEFGSRRCTLDSCAGSLSCLDHPLFCELGEADCTADEDCCQWSEGLSACREGVEGSTCCGLDGALCDGTEDCCDSECISGRCGGETCRFIDDLCRWGVECCSGRCEDNGSGQRFCVEKLCSDPGERCKSADECCGESGTEIGCFPDESGELICKVPTTCADFAQACDPNDAASCCEGECAFAIGTGLAVCISSDPGECKPVGFDCAADADCCQDAICALAVGQSFCQPKPTETCGKAGDDCSGGEDCCSSICTAGACVQATGSTCDELFGLCHSPFVVGTVITADCEESQDPCVQEVVNASPFCRCTAWDTLCVADYVACDQP
jgi:hypothetical protein